MSATHALYRFYATDGTLLYVGITADPGARWRKHAHDKPWWHEIGNITVETHPGRTAVLEAERAAILAEKPLHNVVHNRGTKTAPREVPQLDRLAPIQVGDFAALGLRDGRCPVGEVAALDDVWISLRLKEFMWGTLTNQIGAYRWTDVARMELAYPEDATEGPSEVRGRTQRVMDDKHLGDFQVGWQRAHLGDAKEPVDQAIADFRREEAERRDRRS